MQPSFSLDLRVYYEDTDAGGVVYYANYLKFMERCRTEWLRSLGVNQQQLRVERQLQFAIVNMTVDYLRPALLDDGLTVIAELAGLTAATFSFEQAILRGSERLAAGTVRVACLDSRTLRPRPIPKDILREWRNGR